MAEESTTPDLVERVRASIAAFGCGDFDGALALFGPDSVWDNDGVETFEGLAAIRGFLEAVYGIFESLDIEVEEIRDLGGEVLFAVHTMRGHPVGSTGEVRQRGAFIYEMEGGLVVRLTTYTDIDEARAAAERLAESRG